MLKALLQTFKSLLNMKILKYLWSSLFIVLMIYSVVSVSIYYIVDLVSQSLPVSAYISSRIATIGGLWLGLWFFLPLLIPICIAFFDQALIAELATTLPVANKKISIYSELKFNLKYLIRSLVINFLCAPLYLVPVVGVIVYSGLNGIFLSRQLWRQMLYARVEDEFIKQMGIKYGISLIFIGIFFIFLGLIPLVNLIAPLLCVTIMLYFCEYVCKQEGK